MAPPISLQLYTVRDLLNQDIAATLNQVAEIGFAGVEWAGLGGKTPAEARKIIDDLGLVSSGAHVGLEGLKDPSEAIDTAKTLGYDVMAIPYLGEEYRTIEGYTSVAKQLNEAAPKFADAGIRLGYHNHDFEFEKLADGRTGYDILINETDKELVCFEVDMGWVYVGLGGEQPEGFAAKLAGRVPLVHIKDFKAPASDKMMTELGTGAIDYQPTVDAAESWGVKWLIIEQDHSWVNDDPIESIRVSYAKLKSMV